MKKQEFLAELWKQLSDAPKEDVERSLDYYTEMIEDRIESGMSEEEAVADVGSPEDAAKQIMKELPKKPAGDAAGKPAGDTAAQVKQEAPRTEAAAGSTAQNTQSSSGAQRPRGGYSAEYNEAYDEEIDRMLNRTPEKEVKSSGGSGWKIALLIICFPIWFPLMITALSLIFAAFVTVWALTFAFFAVAVSFALAGVAGIVSLIVHAIAGQFAVGLVHAGIGFFLAGLSIIFFMLAKTVIKGTVGASRGLGRLVTRFFRGKEAE